MLFINLLLYIISFIFIWLGAGMLVSSADKFCKKLKLSSFAVSFFILGLLTSIPEFAVGLTAVSEHDPEIFVGNLLGGITVLFLFVIPLLAIFGNGIKLHHQIEGKTLLYTLLVIVSPSVLVLDKKVTNPEGAFLVVLYVVLFYVIQRKKGIFDHANTNILEVKAYSFKDLIKILFGIIIVFISSQIIVEKTLYFSDLMHISPFYISLIILSLGTNLPELSLATRSVLSGKKDVAFGDYMGSAAANTLLFGVFTLLNDGEVLTISNFFLPFIFISIALALFYTFSRNNIISRRAGFVLLAIYLLFIFLEIAKQ
jgi:cation:H+ antiporter